MTVLGDDPLSSIGVLRAPRTGRPSSETGCRATRPLVLCGVQPARNRGLPGYVYDPQRQIATDPAGRRLGPNVKKDWTSTEGTHTDGDGGDNESWGWEEV